MVNPDTVLVTPPPKVYLPELLIVVFLSVLLSVALLGLPVILPQFVLLVPNFTVLRKRDLGGGLANLVELLVDSVCGHRSEADWGGSVSLLSVPWRDLLSWISNSEPLGLLHEDLGGVTNPRDWAA